MKKGLVLRMISALLAVSVVVFAHAQSGATGDPEKERSAAIDHAKRFLGKKLGVAIDAIKLESATTATWPDSSLGCPEPDRMYAQVVTRGYTIQLSSGSTSYEMHVAGERAALCEKKPPAKRTP